MRIYWGKLPGENPGVLYAWQGNVSMKRDSKLLSHYFETRWPDLFAKPLFSKMEPSLLEELEARGYDITTLKFSINKKAYNT